jgi:hypothetical protein
MEARPAFFDHIGDVVCLRSQEKVSWITAWRVVATVQYAKTVWYRTDVSLEGVPVG